MALFGWLNPNIAIGGLEIGDRAARFLELRADGSVSRQAVVPLSPGAVVEGIVKDGEALAAALARLHAGAYAMGRAIPVVVSVSPALVYTQVFSLPYLAGEALEDAARLNLKMISPSDEGSSYMDWQRVKEGDAEPGAPLEALGAFADAGAIGPYHAALKRAGFVQVAIEFGSLSLSRVVRAAPGLDQAGPYAVVSAGEDGVTFLILANGSPYFTRFVGWKDIVGGGAAGPHGEATMERFREAVGMELRRLMDFYRSRWGGMIGKALVVNVTSGKDLALWIKNDFSLEVFVLGGYQELDKSWLVAAGAALRGIIPRAADRFISLSPIGTEDQFVHDRARRFVSVWARTAYAVMGFMVVAYGGLDAFAAHREGVAKAALAAAGAMPAGAEATDLEAKAAKFNDLVAKGLLAARAASPRANALRAVFATAGDVVLSSVDLDAAGHSIAVVGTAGTEQKAIAFKASLADNPLIERVDMPLSAIVSGKGGTASFSAKIVIK